MTGTAATRAAVARPLGATEAMDRAAGLAARGPGVDPNPRVGAVLADASGNLLGEGFHRGAGTPHAEIAALADARRAGRETAGATAYVTLEPCAHEGRTGPCARALVDAGVARVVYAVADPHRVAAGGAQLLAAAGVAVEHRPHAGADELTRRWRRAVRAGRPWVTWKTATTLDGRTAAADGTSRWITSAAARADVHALRAQCGAIITGTGTALVDDPQLTVRPAGGDAASSTAHPVRVVLGRRELPCGARLLDDAAPTLLVRSRDPHEALAALHERGVRRALLECGPTLAAAFLHAGLVDEIVAYVAPALLGAGPGLVGDLGIGTIADITRLELREVAVVGADARLVLEFPDPPTTSTGTAAHPSTPKERP